ncbi:MAG: PQQ-dependent dehydrogenase, methanol/ethanol family [bacterium]|nr:PQQ-dependent dehydrogenase, methanol/ethanol family [Gammaproteobacteria bacterium]HIL95871.1 PQQ-dependent dehydrogenase, methanol/ethanol family [Pseudomonadales bacterium]
MTRFYSHISAILTVTITILYSASVLAQSIDDAALADESSTEWLAHGRTQSEQRFSPLDQINAANVTNLKLDWFLDLPTAVGLAATPLVSDGVMYFTGSHNVVSAVNARNGKLIWQFDPKVGENSGDRMKVAFLHGSRGVALWNDKVYTVTRDGYLIALSASTGKEVWRVLTVDPTKALYISGAPKVFKGKVLIGNGGTENGGTRGYVTAYDAETGKQVWRFFIVPGNPADGFEDKAQEMAAKTWTGQWWKYGGGGNAWHGFTYDEEFDTLYIGTGNGAPWNRKVRSPGGGDNLFLCSIVALDPDTGEYRWHYQTTPGETWDYNSNMDIVLADLKIAGKNVKAILHAPKNGFFYVIDRATGKLISAEPFTDVSWASKIDLKTGRPVEVPGARYEKEAVIVTPGPLGGHNWPSMSFNPETGLAYIPTIHQYWKYDDDAVDKESWQPPNWQDAAPIHGSAVDFEQMDYEPGAARGSIQAWDPITQKRVWQRELPVSWNPGTLSTSGDLLFQGRADGEFVAYHALTGKTLWQSTVGLGIAAPPITYSIKGRQYVALLVGWGSVMAAVGGKEASDLGWDYRKHIRRLMVFSLSGKLDMPSQPPPTVAVPLTAPFFEVDKDFATTGEDIFGQCAWCHGGAAIAGGLAPDLRTSPMILSEEAFADVVRNGAKRAFGMPSYPALSDSHLNSLRHYIREQADLALAQDPGG